MSDPVAPIPADNRFKFTKARIESLPTPETGRVTYYDSETSGLLLRVSNTGVKTFEFRKKLKGKAVRVTIGKYPGVTCANAISKAAELNGDMTKGINPNEEKRTEKAYKVTLGEAYKDYMAASKKLAHSTIGSYELVMRKYLCDWSGRPLIEISKKMVQARHSGITDGTVRPNKELDAKEYLPSESMANKSLRVLRAIFNFAMDHYEVDQTSLITRNPVSLRQNWHRDGVRKTRLEKSQLKIWFKTVFALKEREDEFAHTASDLFVFILLTGLRRREASGLKWENINLVDRFLVVPDTKNGDPHRLPLSDYLYELLARRKKVSHSEYVFPGGGDNDSINDPRRILNSVREQTGIVFTLHDLRRTFISIGESLDISAYALKKLANHRVKGDVTENNYIVMDNERLRAPMQKITDYILEHAGIKAGQDVVGIPDALAS